MPPRRKTREVVHFTATKVVRTAGTSEGDRPARFSRKDFMRSSKGKGIGVKGVNGFGVDLVERKEGGREGG